MLPEAETAPRSRRQQALLDWYAVHARALPWRQSSDPYRILVSEVMLQQTQVDRVVPFFERFISRFPDLAALAAASQEELHRVWKGLGYPSRVERLQRACQVILARGSWPQTPDGLRELPGIGPYTAGAVAAQAFAVATPVVDTNVARVYTRTLGLALPVDRPRLWETVAAEVDRRDPATWTNALMELGALVCTARAPRCTACPWSLGCASRGQAEAIAASSNPLKVASRRIAYGDAITNRRLPRSHIVLAVIHDDGRYLVARRGAARHAGGCWELPGGKREVGEDDRTALAREVGEELGGEVLAARSLVRFSHAYPDRYLTFHCYRVRVFAPQALRPLASEELRWVTPAELLTLEFPPANAPLLARLARYHRLDR